LVEGVSLITAHLMELLRMPPLYLIVSRQGSQPE
jgi:hypothetical protein